MHSLFETAWIPATVFLLSACGARLLSRSWVAPSTFAPAVWSGFVTLALWAAPEYPVSAISVWMIVALALAVTTGAHLGEAKPSQQGSVQQSHPTRQVKLLPFLIFFSVLASAGAIYLAIGALNEHGLSYTLGGLLAVGHFLSVTRYSGEQEPLLYRALITWIYPAAILGGIDFVLSDGRGRKLISLAAFAPGLLVGVFQSERAPTLIAFCLWLGTFLATKCYKTGAAFHFSRNKLVTVMACFVLTALCFYIFLDAIRANEKQDDFIVEADWKRVKSSFLGSLSVFSYWTRNLDAAPISYGAYTFAGVFDFLGAHTRQQGVFENPILLPDGTETNVYSAFRGLIQDFSFVGAVIVCIAAGFLAGSAYRYSSMGRFEWVTVLAPFYAFVCFSPIISIFTYNGPILAVIVCAYFCRLMSRPSVNRQRGRRNVGLVLQSSPRGGA